MEEQMQKVYDPQKVEEKWYRFWLQNKLFNSKFKEGLVPFSIVIPPPNVTGILHMGHALNNTLQDIIIRFKRMQNYNTLWIPGTDHGGIATQNVVEKLIMSKGKTRHDLGREKFLEKMWEWRAESGDVILKQLQRLGCSLDWDRTRFTMDEVYSKAVLYAFVELYHRGLIYRGKRLVNWCPRCQTALADIEVEHEEELGKLWHIKYPIKQEKSKKKNTKKISSEKQEFIIVATTRPETMLGDTAVAVHPDDKRYKKFIGKKIILPLMNREIPIIADDAVDPTFGTGAVKVTPAHDPIDFEIGERHKLPHVVVIDTKGAMTKETKKYEGLDRYEARKEVLSDIEHLGLLLETANHPHSIGHCYRCDTTIEPMMSEQWFLDVKKMSEKAMQVVKDGKIKFYPESWVKPYLLWLENLKDWCISRQIWWGHRIPVYYCLSKEKNKKDKKKKTTKTKCPPIVSLEKPDKCPKCGGKKIEQDPDVLDTWFSSSLWPFGVFYWPYDGQSEQTRLDLKYYYPTNVLVTGHEILYLWVARMVQMGMEFMGEVPFKELYIHGIVRDKFGKKMSKSLGNIIDPIEIMNKYGTDALRFSLAQFAAPGRDMQLSDDSFISARNFVNKIWNASRFVLMHLSNLSWEPGFMAIWPLEFADKWILSEYRILIDKVTVALSEYNIDTASRILYDFIWTKYCDWYIELVKIRLNGTDESKKKVALSVLTEVLSGILRLLHPIMPYVTEEIWHTLVRYLKPESHLKSISITTYSWPEYDQTKIDSVIINKMILLQEIVTAIRTIRSEMNVPPAKKVKVIVNIHSPAQKEILQECSEYLKFLAKIEDIEISENILRPNQSAVTIISGVEIFVPLSGLIDTDKEKQRLIKEHENAEVELERCKKNLENPDFLKRAPKFEVEKVKNRLKNAEIKIERLLNNIKSLE